MARRPRSTGFVAAKIRANTARRNGLPAQKKDKYKKYLTSRDAPNVGGVGRRKLKRQEEKATRQKGKYRLREELAPMDQAQMDAALAAEALEAQMERVAAQEARHSHIESEWGTWADLDYASERARRKMAEAYGTPYLSKKERALYEKSQKGQQERAAWRRREEERARAGEKAYFVEEAAWDSQDQPSVAVGLSERRVGEAPYRQPISPKRLLAKYDELYHLYMTSQIDEETYHRLKRSLVRAKKSGRGMGAVLAEMERAAKRHKPSGRRRKKKLPTVREKEAQARRRKWKALDVGTGHHIPPFKTAEVGRLYAEQLTDMQAPTISREEARQPDDPFADFMFHEGSDEFFKENPRRARRNGGVLERSSHSYDQWVPYLNRGISPHNNPVHIIEVGQGRTGRVPQGVKAYYAGNVQADGTSFTLGRGGLVIVNTKPNRVVFITP